MDANLPIDAPLENVKLQSLDIFITSSKRKVKPPQKIPDARKKAGNRADTVRYSPEWTKLFVTGGFNRRKGQHES